MPNSKFLANSHSYHKNAKENFINSTLVINLNYITLMIL